MALLRLSQTARKDLKGIGRYTHTRWGREQRIIYLAGLQQAMERLAETPHLAPEYPDFAPPVRFQRYGRHLIVFCIVEDGGVLVLRLLHESMDVRRQLTSDFAAP